MKKTKPTATVLSRTLGTWGFHETSVGNDLEIELEFADGISPSRRQRVVVYHTIDLEDDDAGTKLTLDVAAKQLVASLNEKAEISIDAVVAAVGAERVDGTITTIGA